MALKVNMAETPIGVPCPAAYVRITEVGGSLQELLVMVEIHADASARQKRAQGVRPIDRRRHSIDPAALSGPLGAAIYSHLKTLPEYAGAEDV